MAAKKKPERWLIVTWQEGSELSPRLYSMNGENEMLTSEAMALALVKTLEDRDNIMVAKVARHYKTRRVMEQLK